MNGAGNMLYAGDGAGAGSIQVFNGSFNNVTAPGEFVDPDLPAGSHLVPFNVEDMGGTVYVTYAPSGHANQVDAPAGSGVTFTESGTFIKNLVTGGPLAYRWGLALAPTGFGSLGGDLLVGNLSAADGDVINAFNATTGAFGTAIDISPGALPADFGI
jgi:uncharacterized protein (TIGR03118 family)